MCYPLALCTWPPMARTPQEGTSGQQSGLTAPSQPQSLTSPVCGQCEPNKSLAGYREPSEFSLPASQTQGPGHHGALDPERSPVLWGGFL